mmetsp:Transcript_10713/g.16011  ORF Transcript_10713/g.16011 Transcript_10713/m.16011 type:complete len:99 (-) Transcript_10713:115-411(-)
MKKIIKNVIGGKSCASCFAKAMGTTKATTQKQEQKRLVTYSLHSPRIRPEIPFMVGMHIMEFQKRSQKKAESMLFKLEICSLISSFVPVVMLMDVTLV